MQENAELPPWPRSTKDWERLGALADYIDDMIARERESWIAEAGDPHSKLLKELEDGERITQEEGKLLVSALRVEGDSWQRIVSHLHFKLASPKFFKLVTLLLEHNILSRTREPNAVAYRYEPGDLADAEDLELIERILLRLYRDDAATRKKDSLGRYTTAVAAILRAPPVDRNGRNGRRIASDEQRFVANAADIGSLKKRMARDNFLLSVIDTHIRLLFPELKN
ncbi:MAG: hypothetical protein O9309_11515 [Rhizobium sp.]|nr:hypothetical protein [Rhizobium sp.]MCZ8349223.1 hypothetical protein [Rhizobium sp.]